MLKKLIKYEWKDTRTVGIICNGIVLALAVIGVLLFSLDIWNESSLRSEVMAELTGVTIVLYFVMIVWGIVAACLVVKYYFFYRYYKNLFTDQGYLMNTLPVKSTELLNAKLIVASLWQYITIIVIAVSIFALGISMIGGIGDLSVKEILRDLWEIDINWDDVFQTLPTSISYIIYILIAPIGGMLWTYTAVCLGQTTKKHKFLVSVLILIGFNLLLQVVVSYMTLPFSLMMEEPSVTTVNIVSVVLLVVYIAVIIGLYFINKYFLEKKLNLE